MARNLSNITKAILSKKSNSHCFLLKLLCKSLNGICGGKEADNKVWPSILVF